MSDCEICINCGDMMLVWEHKKEGGTVYFCPVCKRRITK